MDDEENHIDDSLENKKEEIQKLNVEYLATQEFVKGKQKKVETLKPDFEKIDSRIFDLANYRDRLNKAVRDYRKERDNTEAHLTYVKSQLVKYETAVIDARKNVEKARRDAKPLINQWQSANSELQDSEKALALAYEKLKAAQQEYTLAGGRLTSEEKAIEKPDVIIKDQQITPWKSILIFPKYFGFFFLDITGRTEAKDFTALIIGWFTIIILIVVGILIWSGILSFESIRLFLKSLTPANW